MQNQGNMYQKMTKEWNFYLFWGPNWPKRWTPEDHILHTSTITYNEHVKQYWCENSDNFVQKWPKTWIMANFGAQN